LATALLCLAACSTDAGDSSNDAGHGTLRDGGADLITFPDASTTIRPDASAYQGPAIVYGESASTLYRLDPNTKAVTIVGDFSGCSSVIDLALDKDSNLYVTTFAGLYTVNSSTAV
jgi:hypothetical protein